MISIVLLVAACSNNRAAEREGEIAALKARVTELEAEGTRREETRKAAVDETAGLKERLEAGRRQQADLEARTAKAVAKQEASAVELRAAAEALEQCRRQVRRLEGEIADLSRELERVRFRQRSADDPEKK